MTVIKWLKYFTDFNEVKGVLFISSLFKSHCIYFYKHQQTINMRHCRTHYVITPFSFWEQSNLWRFKLFELWKILHQLSKLSTKYFPLLYLTLNTFLRKWNTLSFKIHLWFWIIKTHTLLLSHIFCGFMITSIIFSQVYWWMTAQGKLWISWSFVWINQALKMKSF